MRIRNSQILIGGLIFVLLISLYSLCMEFYLSSSEKEVEIDPSITSIELYSQKALITFSESEDGSFRYALNRSRQAEEKIYGNTLRLYIPTGVLELKIPGDKKLDNLFIESEESPVSIYKLNFDNIYIGTEGEVDIHGSVSTRAEISAKKVIMTDVSADKMDVDAEESLEMTGCKADELDLYFTEDSYVLSSSVLELDAYSEKADLEVELENGISTASVTGRHSTIFINGEDSYESQLETGKEGGALLLFETGSGNLYI